MVCCVHCGQTYLSDQLEWRPGGGPGALGAWCCPTPGCDGVGFLYDIWPIDPEWTDENGNRICFFDDDDEEWEDADYLDDECCEDDWLDEEEEPEPWARSLWGDDGPYEPEEDDEAWKGEGSPDWRGRLGDDDDPPF